LFVTISPVQLAKLSNRIAKLAWNRSIASQRTQKRGPT
jgi:hypothetical protein